ncbi:MAG TPA: hypothetical protein VE987_22990, partial [Polyangiaceae bacterium]|nr:hypothetical protein [Polyangiaceae bacterium]
RRGVEQLRSRRRQQRSDVGVEQQRRSRRRIEQRRRQREQRRVVLELVELRRPDDVPLVVLDGLAVLDVRDGRRLLL